MFLAPRKRRALSGQNSQVTAVPLNVPIPHSLPLNSVTNLQPNVESNPSQVGASSSYPIHVTTPINSASTSGSTPIKRMYACRICGVLLSSASNRSRHERAKHINTEARQNTQNQSGSICREPIEQQKQQQQEESRITGRKRCAEASAIDVSQSEDSIIGTPSIDEANTAVTVVQFAATDEVEQLMNDPTALSSNADCTMEEGAVTGVGEIAVGSSASSATIDSQPALTSATVSALTPHCPVNATPEADNEGEGGASSVSDSCISSSTQSLPDVTAPDSELQQACFPFLQ